MSTATYAPHVTPIGPILRAAARSDREPTCLYFVQESGSGHIKIGVSRDPTARMRLLRVDNPHDLTALGLFRVDPFAERDAHAIFGHLRVRGEWFRDAPEIRDHIARLASIQEFAW